MNRALKLVTLSFYQVIHRLRHDLARESVVIICGFILLSLFYYIFNDFLNIEINSLSSQMRDHFGLYLALALYASTAIASGQFIRKEFALARSFPRTAQYLGENPDTIKLYWLIKTPILLAFFHIPANVLAYTSLVHWQMHLYIIAAATSLLVSLGIAFYQGSKKKLPEKEVTYKPLLNKVYRSPLISMFLWKVKQLLFRNKSTQLGTLLTLFLASSLVFLTIRKAPDLLLILVSYLSGVSLALTLALQISYDMNYAWIEKNMGISHERYLLNLQLTALVLSLSVSFVSALSYVMGLLLEGQSLFTISSNELIFCSQIFFISFIGPFLVPYLAFQVDPKRFFIQFITIILASFFIGTAIYASLFSLILLPFITYYGLQSQQGRFYRA